MRLLFVGRRYWPAIGGVESLMRDLAKELASRHEVRVLALRTDDGPLGRLSDSLRPPRPFEPFRDGPVAVEPLRLPAWRRGLMAPLLFDVTPGLRRYAYGGVRAVTAAVYAHAVAPVIARQAKGTDLIHIWGGDLLAAAAVRAAGLLHLPAVVTPFAHRARWSDDPGSAAAYRKADRVIALQESDAALYLDLGVPRSRVVVCGACSRALRPEGGLEIRRRFGVDGPLILFLGARRPHKGLALLLEAATLVALERPEVTFAVVGPGPRVLERPGPRLVDVGAVDELERSDWLDAADLLCLPSESETFGIVVLEAWSLRTPVVVSDIPPLRELVDNAGGGVAAPRDPRSLAQVILGLLAEPERLRALGEAGNSYWRNHFTVAAVAKRLEEVYASSAAPSRHPSGASPSPVATSGSS
jgi:glycosyltransferase involved in cell wall biosynthesis